jgi:hypothetical protein
MPFFLTQMSEMASRAAYGADGELPCCQRKPALSVLDAGNGANITGMKIPRCQQLLLLQKQQFQTMEQNKAN